MFSLESYDDEEGGDIFTNLMREAIDQPLDLDLVSELSSSPSDLEDELDFDFQIAIDLDPGLDLDLDLVQGLDLVLQ